ncbi:MAG: general secretion pathway protein GspD, partial [Planctomycetota bacterium]|nr:general secretion pathway protein GspD [Planctomycetota bacterium]
TSDEQERLKRMIATDVARQSRQAVDQRESNPLAALEQLKNIRAMVGQSDLNSNDKQVMTSRVDRMIAETEKYIEQHRAEIENEQRNTEVLADVKRARDYKIEVQQRVAALVDEYNKLRDDQRFYEAEAKAREARELAPDEPVVTQMWQEIRFYRRVVNNRQLEADKDEGVWAALHNAEVAAVPFDERNPIRFAEDWEELSLSRRRFSGDSVRDRHPAELEIERKLTTPVSMKFKDAPLGEVIQYIKQVAGINIYLDPQGLAEEGVHPSTPVTIDLSQEISLRSAMKLILQPLNLNYVITNEVLKITSDQLRDRTVYPKTYNVADLVIPIPDFVPHDRLGLPIALARGYDVTNGNLAGGAQFQPPVMGVAQGTAATPEGTLAQNTSPAFSTGRPGGTSSADFDALIELITKTIEPDSWDEVGGQGTVAEFETNLSLVISQTQEIHEKIADLLDQLRRLQDLQVTIEVRFITLTENFFEQIGIDFDFNIPDNNSTLPPDDGGPSTTVGLNFANGVPTGQIALGGNTYLNDAIGNPLPNGPFPYGAQDIQVRQGNFPAVPAFGGFDPAFATTFGIAILSDIEAFFVLRAAQGDTRSNIMQAPRVTLFNGQAASISDQVQEAFVISVTPIVGDFAAAQAPVIVVLAEGTTLSVQAVISPDRRFVRLTLVPFFSEIKDVNEFTFNGSQTTTTVPVDSDEGGDKVETKTV